MRKLKIMDSKMVKFLRDKNQLVEEGRKISKEIEEVDKDIAKNNEKQKEYTIKVEPPEIVKRGQDLVNEINALLQKLDDTAKEMENKKLEAIPFEVRQEYFELKDRKEKLEKERNKTALKVQKIKDKVIPMVRKRALPLITEYEDINTAEVENGVVVVEVVDLLQEKLAGVEKWKTNFTKIKGSMV